MLATHETKPTEKPALKTNTIPKEEANQIFFSTKTNIPAQQAKKEPKNEPIDEVIKTYNFYKNVETYISELDNIIRSAQKLKQVLQENKA